MVFLNSVLNLLNSGGDALWLILIVSVCLWALICERLIFFRFVFLVSTHLYKIGNTIKVKSVDVNIPPITTVANGRCTSAPADVDIAIGKKPRISVEAVSKMGLILRIEPFLIISLILNLPSDFSSLKPEISTNPLRTATPKSTIKPTPAEILKGISRM